MTQQLPLLGTLAVEADALNPQTYEKAPRRYPTLRELPESERPVHRLHFYGPAALSTSELLAILAGTPHQLQDAANLMAAFESIEGVARANMSELQQQPGIGASTAARIKAAFELGRRLIVERPADGRDGSVGAGTPAHHPAGYQEPRAGHPHHLRRLGQHDHDPHLGTLSRGDPPQLSVDNHRPQPPLRLTRPESRRCTGDPAGCRGRQAP